MVDRLTYSANSAHKGQQVTRGACFHIESVVLMVAAVGFTVWKYAGLASLIVDIIK